MDNSSESTLNYSIWASSAINGVVIWRKKMYHKARLASLIVERALQFGDFKLASGQKSDFYLDLSTITLHPEGLSLICKCFWDTLLNDYSSYGIDAIAGPMSGADPIIGAMVAQSYFWADPIIGAMVAQSHFFSKNIVGLMVRSEAKDHGDGKLVEGPVRPGMRVVVVEDVVTTGGSVCKAMDSLKKAGCHPVVVLSVVDRGNCTLAREVKYHPLFRLEDLAISKKMLNVSPGVFPCNIQS
jgi:orotate phosphoribosyltransferase